MEKKRRTSPPNCASCKLEVPKRICLNQEGAGSKGCPTLTNEEVLKEANKEYDIPHIKEFARQSSIQEAECYANRHQKPYIRQPSKTRIVEICEFAQKMGYKRLGLAFCIGLSMEAKKVEEILHLYDFEVISALCKAGRTSKDLIDIKDEEKINWGTDEAMCNPIYQAKLFNKEKTDFNILMGLCVGHDSLFFKYADALTTVLAVKDRLTGHNPLVAIYQSESFFSRIKHPGYEEG
jgi:uncharacterized metal-binding protein